MNLLPRHPARLHTSLSKHLNTARPFDDLRVPVPRTTRGIEPLEQETAAPLVCRKAAPVRGLPPRDLVRRLLDSPDQPLRRFDGSVELADPAEHCENSGQGRRVDALHRRMALQAARRAANDGLVHRADVALLLR